MVKRLVLIAALLVLSTAVAGCAAQRESQGPETIDGVFIHGVVAGTIDSKSNERDICRHMDPFQFHVDGRHFDLGTYYTADGRGPVQGTLLPEPRTVVTVWVPDRWVQYVESGGEFAIGMLHAFDSCGNREYRWEARLLFDAHGSVLGEPSFELNQVAANLDAMRVASESDLEVALAFFEERRNHDNAVGRGDAAPPTPRMDALRVSRDDTADRIASQVGVWAARPPVERQLPVDVENERAVTDLQRKALGLDEWSRWEISFVYDRPVTERYRWVALQIGDAGFVGPYYLDPTQTITATLSTYGPATAPVSVTLWPPGEPRTFSGSIGTVDPIRRDDTVFEVDAKARSVLDSGGGIVVDLRGDDITIHVVDAAGYSTLLGVHADPGMQGSETGDDGRDESSP